MTYIKWKDEVESYLVSLPQEEKQKIFSYFSEMYADKRDAGKSEEQIIEEFGAPYDVAKKILAESKEAAAPQEGGAANVSGGNNYNYNYYNYNYGGAPQTEAPPQSAKQPPRENVPAPAPAPTPPPPPPAKEKPKKQKSGVQIFVGIILAILLVGLSVTLIGSCIAGIVQGFITVGMSVGMLASGNGTAAMALLNVGYGVINVGLSFILLAPFSALIRVLWKNLRKII